MLLVSGTTTLPYRYGMKVKVHRDVKGKVRYAAVYKGDEHITNYDGRNAEREAILWVLGYIQGADDART